MLELRILRDPSFLVTQAVRYRRHGHSLQRMRSVGKSGAGSKQHILHKLKTGVPAKQALVVTPTRRAARAEPKLGIVAAIRKRSQFVNRLCIIYCRCLAPFSFFSRTYVHSAAQRCPSGSDVFSCWHRTVPL